MSNIISQVFLAIGAIFSSFVTQTPQQLNQTINTQQQAQELQSLPQVDQKTIAELEKNLQNRLQITVSKKTNKITSLTSPNKTIPIEASTPQGESSEALARRFLTQYGTLFGVTDPVKQLIYIETTGELADFLDTTTRRTIKLGSFNPQATAHIKFQQIYNNIPVYASYLTIHIKINREVSSVTSDLIPITSLNTLPTIQLKEAQQEGLQFISSKYHNIDQTILTSAEPTLVIFDDSLFTMSPTSNPTLTYVTRITSTHPPITEDVFIDAITGTALGNISKIIKLDRVIYNCNNTPTCTDFPNNPSVLENQTARDEASQKVYDFLSITHNYFKNTHNRNGANNLGGTGNGQKYTDFLIDTKKTYGFANAGTAEGSSYSDGWSVNIAPQQFTLDVVAHEFVHLIKSFIYIQQGGALSEAVADILGNDVEKKDWTLDQENGTVRDMANPQSGSEPQPDRLFSSNYYCSFSEDLGSHRNNGVLNKTAYLISEGGSFNGCTITGIGREKMAKIVYSTFVNYLGNKANFRSFYDAMVASCNDTYGASSNECTQVIKAMQATEIDQQQSDTPWSSSCPQLCVKRTGNLIEDCTAGQEGCECTEKIEYHKPLCATSAVISLTPTTSVTLTSTPTPAISPVPTSTPTASPALQPTTTNKPTTTPIPSNTTLQVDWVYENQGRCWSAWAAPSCSLQGHQGQASLAFRDLDHDGTPDITCSEGGTTENTTTITNTSDKTFSINCEYYTCNACTTDASGAFAQCDGANFEDTQRIAETIELTPDCTATCTNSGAYGTCTPKGNLPQSQPTTTPTNTPQSPTTTIQTGQTQPSSSPTLAPVQNSSISSLISQISVTQVQDLLKNLVDNDEIEGFDEQQTRYTGTTGFATEFNYVKDYLESLNLTVEIQEFNEVNSSLGGAYSCPNTPMKNLIVKIPGKKTDKPYLVTAHLDSTSDSAQKDPAPGADDNASGSVALIEIARTLKNLPNQPDYPIELVLFDAEEEGLCGSAYYVENLPAEKKIQGVINLDMIGNNNGGNSCVNFYYENYTGANLLSEKINAAIITYNLNLNSQSLARDIPSDQKSFTYKQIPAIIGTECSSSPVKHTAEDKINSINFEQITATTKAVLAGLLELTLSPSSGPTITPQSEPSSTPTITPPATTSLPPMIIYNILSSEIAANTSPYIYGWLTDTYLQNKNFDQETTRQINEIKNITTPSHKMMLVSSLETLDKLLSNSAELKSAGITILGYNTERAVGTPDAQMNNLLSLVDNPVAAFAQKTQAQGFQSLWGPTRPIATNLVNNNELIKHLADSGLSGFVFQEQKYIENQSYTQRAQVVKEDIAKINQAAQKDLHISVQIMPSRCGSAPWTNCKNFITEIKNDIDSLAIWPAGETNSLIANFYQTMTASSLPPALSPTPSSIPTQTPTQGSNLEKETLALFNAERTANGVQALIWDNRLALAARNHARDQSEHGLLSHTGSDGSTLNDRLNKVGYRFTATAGENVGLGDTTGQEALASTRSSPAHYQNLLTSAYLYAGVGWFIDPNNAQNNRWVLVLAD